MTFSSAEISQLDLILRRQHYYIWPSNRWGDLCDIRNEGDGTLLFVHRPLGYKGVVFVVGLLGMALVVGFRVAVLTKAVLFGAIIVGIFAALYFQPKRAISFFTDPEHKRLAFRVAQKKGGKGLSRLCEIHSFQNELLATISTHFSWGSKTTWRVYRPNRELWARAAGDVSWKDKIRALIFKYQHASTTRYKAFQIFQKESSISLGAIDLHSGSGDHLNLQADPDCTLDRRVALALAVVMRSL